MQIDNEYSFLKNGGRAGLLLSRSEAIEKLFGPVSQWPDIMRFSLEIMFRSPLPMFLVWGSEKIFFCNDAFLPFTENYNAGDTLYMVLGNKDKNACTVLNNMIDSGYDKPIGLLNLSGKNNTPETIRQTASTACTPLFAIQGKVDGVLVSCNEITLQEEDEKTFARINEDSRELASIFEDSPVGIATIMADKDLTFLSVNKFYCGLVGRQRYELIGMPLLEALPEIRGQGFEDLLFEVIDSGIPYTAKEVEVKILRNSLLEFIYVDLIYQLIEDENSKIKNILVVATDVTQQVISRREVEESESKVKNLIAAAPAGICLFVGRDLIIEYPNQTFIDMVAGGSDIEGLSLREAMPGIISDRKQYVKVLDDVFVTGIPFISPSSLVRSLKDGILKDNYYNISYTPIRNNTGKIYAVLYIAVDVTQQVYAQQAMEKSEAHLQLLRDTVPAMIFYLDEKERYQSYNSVFKEWFSIDNNEAIGRSVLEFIGEAAYAKVKPHLDIAYGGIQEKYEMFAPSRMGVGRWLSIVYTPHITSTGKVVGLIVHATDITKSKVTEMALRESETKLIAVLDAAPVAVCLFLGEKQVVSNANLAFIKDAGKGEDIENIPLADILTDDDSKNFIQKVKEVYSSGTSYYANGIPGINSTEKNIQYHNISLIPLFESTGEVYAVLYTGSDVTRELNYINRIEQAEASLRSAVEIAELGTWTMDVESAVTTLSKRHAEMFGFTKLTMSSEEARSVIHPSDRKRVSDAFFCAQRIGSDGRYEAEYKINDPITGKQKIIHSIGQTSFDHGGKPLRISGTAQDITIHRELQLALENQVETRTRELAEILKELQVSNTELAQSNDSLKRSNQELAQFAYVASHDLQEPLRKIQFFAGMLKEGKSSMSDETIINKIASSSSRMSLLISDLLAFSRLIKPDKAFKDINIKEVVENVWTDFELTAQQTNASIRIDELPIVKAVGLQMNQLFYNLISNSLKFIDKGKSPKIRITSDVVKEIFVKEFSGNHTVASEYFHIKFSDNGIGFEKEHEKQIFEIFNRLHGQTIFPGSGIGLALCRRIVMNHQGELFAESKVGIGTTFHIFLPVEQKSLEQPDIF